MREARCRISADAPLDRPCTAHRGQRASNSPMLQAALRSSQLDTSVRAPLSLSARLPPARAIVLLSGTSAQRASQAGTRQHVRRRWCAECVCGLTNTQMETSPDGQYVGPSHAATSAPPPPRPAHIDAALQALLSTGISGSVYGTGALRTNEDALGTKKFREGNRRIYVSPKVIHHTLLTRRVDVGSWEQKQC